MSANQRPNPLHGGGNSPAFSSHGGPSSDTLRKLIFLIAKDAGIEMETDNPITLTREIRQWIAQQKRHTEESKHENE